MKMRSQVHMLNVAAARLEQDHANPILIKDLREAAKRMATLKAEGRGYNQEDEKRIERQRTLFSMLPDTRAVDALKAAMLQRAYDLMWDGDCSGTDAIAEFLPSAAVQQMFEAWEDDQQVSKDKRSAFYSGEIK